MQLLTDEVGLIARKSIAQVGDQVIFLSDNGVYGLKFVDRFNLRGTEIPISESIQKTIDRINKEEASKAVAVYFDNRYYLAVPLNKEIVTINSDGNQVVTTETALFNNAILIYNFLNKSWESIDTVNDELIDAPFEFHNLIVAGEGNERGVYVVNEDGGLHRLETEVDGRDRVITTIQSVANPTTQESRIQGSVTTRMFTLKSIDRKKWNNFELHMQSSADNSSDFDISVTTENVDNTVQLNSVSELLGNEVLPNEDVSVRGRIGNLRAYGIQMTLTNTLGRPRFRSIKVAGGETFRSTSSVE